MKAIARIVPTANAHTVAGSVSNQPFLIGAVDAVPHKRVHGGGARLRMFVPLVQDGRTMYPGYAAVEYVQVRCRSRHAHLDP